VKTPRLSGKLDELPATLALFANFDPAEIATALIRCTGGHAFAVGSGGSLVAAEYLALCRDSLGLGSTSVATPMQVVVERSSLAATQVWLFSAGADNPDAIAAARSAIDRHCGDLNLLTRNPEGAAAVLVRQFGGSVHVVPVSEVKDGYLSTHSLLAMTSALFLASGIASREPRSTSDLLEKVAARLAASRDTVARQGLVDKWTGFLPSDTLIIAADPLLRTVASLLETSLWEAALCPVQTTDFRNLAHGRHAWFHHRAHETALLALTGCDSRLASSLIDAALPEEVRRSRADYGNCGRLENLLGLVDGFALIEALGEIFEIDPGKPGIGEFGRVIYADRSLEALAQELPVRVRHKRAAMAKAGTADASDGLASIAQDRLQALAEADVGGAVFDYDGTIVTTEGRFETPDQRVVAELVRLHRAGLRLGIATGRGGSAGEDLRKVLPGDVLSSTIIGYYNGGYLRTADIDIRLDPPVQNAVMTAIEQWLEERPDLFIRGKYKAGPLQIGIDMKHLRYPYRFALDIAHCPEVANGKASVLASGHSFDIIPSTSSKIVVVEAVREAARPGTEVLCFGDSGSRGGNDHALLSHPFGVSVGDVCSAPDGCWSLFGGRVTGPEALLKIMQALVPSEGGKIRFDVDSLLLDKP
jgi:hydroxymethylpyrimidine pyrophosphatase-like HAD family hydrolase